MSVPYMFSPKAITVVIRGRTHVVPSSATNFEDLKVALRKNATEAEIAKVLDIRAYYAQLTEGRADIVDGKLWFDGAPIHNVLADRVAVMLVEGLGVLPLLRFLNRVAVNPRKDIGEELYPFLESGNCPITEEGFVLAYKLVRRDFKDHYTGTMDNSPGKIVEMNREEVNDNRYHTCAQGLHFASLQYIESGAYRSMSDSRLVMVKIDPADIVSIPIDYNRSKGRAWKYEIVQELELDDRIKAMFVSDDDSAVDRKTNDVWDSPYDVEPETESDAEVEDSGDDDIQECVPETVNRPSNTKLSYEDVIKIHEKLNEDGVTLKAIAALYDISPRQVGRIRDGEVWVDAYTDFHSR